METQNITLQSQNLVIKQLAEINNMGKQYIEKQQNVINELRNSLEEERKKNEELNKRIQKLLANPMDISNNIKQIQMKRVVLNQEISPKKSLVSKFFPFFSS